MAKFSKAKCDGCGSVTQHKTRGKIPPTCACGETKRWFSPWYVKLRDENGKPIVTTHATSALADKYESEQKALKSNGESIAVRDTTFLNAYNLFIAWCEKRAEDGKLSNLSYLSYRGRIDNHVLPYFKAWDIRRIDHDAMDAYVSARKKERYGTAGKRYSSGQINRELSALKAIMSMAVTKKLIRENLTKGYEVLPENSQRDRVLNPDEISRLLECCKESPVPYLHSMVVIALNTGLRREGIMGLCWEHIVDGVIVRTVKGGKEVRIPMNDDVIKELQRWSDIRYQGTVPLRKTGLIFPSPVTGKAILCSSNIGFDAAVEKAGITDFRFHDLRHCAATYLIAHCRDIHMVAKILGHSTSFMTERYAHIIEERTKAMMNSFSYSANGK